jgi:phycoerythrin-associated linker protein
MHHFEPLTVSRTSSVEERQAALIQIYYQVLERQPYTYERNKLARAEKDFLKNKIGVRRFLKELGKSEVYLEAFYYKFSNMKFLELCLKHFLGRAVLNSDEMQVYSNILTRQGVVAMITAILDSEEYCKVFGCFTVPYRRERAYYESPKLFLETHLLNHESAAQRSSSLPTLYWRQLGLVCEAGVCRHPEADEVLEPLNFRDEKDNEVSIEQLLRLLQSSTPTKAKEIVASLSSQQRAILRQAIH